MFTSAELQQTHTMWTPPAVKPLDEVRWQSWLAGGRAQDQRRSATFMRGVKWVSLVGLLAAAANWPHLGPNDPVVRFVVAVGALAMMFQALRSRFYVVAAVFGALVLLYNPLAPVFAFSGEWQSGLVVASAVPFVASLAWNKPRMEPNA
jgi:hypothetical protein